jgi:hypothetical protein
MSGEKTSHRAELFAAGPDDSPDLARVHARACIRVHGGVAIRIGDGSRDRQRAAKSAAQLPAETEQA